MDPAVLAAMVVPGPVALPLDAVDVAQLVDGGERTLAGAVVDDALSRHRAHAGEAVQFGGAGGVQVQLRLGPAGLGRDALDFSAANDDLSEMLALLSLLEDYVGVSNTNMHLAAAAGATAAAIRPRSVSVTRATWWARFLTSS